MKSILPRSMVTACIVFQSFALYADPNNEWDWVKPALEEFQADTRAFMNTPPTIVGEPAANATRQDTIAERFASREAIKQRDVATKRASPESEPTVIDNPRFLLGTQDRYFTSLKAIEDNFLLNASIRRDMWSGDYWPTYRGGIATRYNDPFYPNDLHWLTNYNYYLANPRDTLLGNNFNQAMLYLSPAEKFDLLIDAPAAQGLARSAWLEGKNIFDRRGSVESWMGICHGWAVASYTNARPTRTIQLKNPRGFLITFTPDDVKALFSYWRARDPAKVRFVGGKCANDNPATDPSTGRIVDPLCYDNNASTWHLAIVNMIGANQLPFIMDVSLDRQVWNQPVKAYSFVYFNPKTMETATTWQAALMPSANFPNDKFKRFRSSKTQALIGIAMNVSYLAEGMTPHASTNNASHDTVRIIRYLYDLEVDAAGTIVGGEWYQNMHPDFLWSPIPGSVPQTIYDAQMTGAWDMNQPLPATWRSALQQAALNGQLPTPFMLQLNRAFVGQ